MDYEKTGRDYTGPNRRTVCPDAAKINEHLASGHSRMAALESSLASMQSDVAEVLEILNLGKSFFKVIGHFGTLIKWLTAVGAPIVAIYWTVKGGKS